MLVPPTIIGRVEQRIDQTGPADRINSLILDQIPIGTFTEQLRRLLERCDKLEHFSLESCSLDSLQNFPNLPKLEVVELNSNRLGDSDIGMLSKFPKMRRIFIKDNRIDNLESLDVLGCLGELVQLELNGNPVIEAQNYRQSIFNTQALPQTRVKSLQILDNKDRDGVDIDDISQEVQYSLAQSEGSDTEKQVSQDEDSGDDQSCSEKEDDGEDSPVVDVVRKMRKTNPQ